MDTPIPDCTTNPSVKVRLAADGDRFKVKAVFPAKCTTQHNMALKNI